MPIDDNGDVVCRCGVNKHPDARPWEEVEQEIYDHLAQELADAMDQHILESVLTEIHDEKAKWLEEQRRKEQMEEVYKLAEVAVDWGRRVGIIDPELNAPDPEQEKSDAYDRAMGVFDD